MNYIVASSRPGYESVFRSLQQEGPGNFVFLNSKKELMPTKLKAIHPRYLFFPHWSHLLPPSIYKPYECVIFHMTDVPFGRGGSPLQNLIARGITETKISALRCTRGIDAGPVYMKRPFSLHGSAEEIYLRAAAVIREMIIDIIRTNPVPAPQNGHPVTFKRRTPPQSNVAKVSDLKQLFDFIRMLDAEGYPRAYLETNHFRIELSRASLKPDAVEANVKITPRKTHG